MARPVDAEALEKKISEWLGQPGNGDYYSGYDAALCAVQDLIADTPTITPPNEPLTLEQLRKMDGKPVWVKVIGKTGISCDGWCEVEIREKDRFAYVWWPGSEVEDIAKIEDYGKTWACYAYPPAHIDREAWKSCKLCEKYKVFQFNAWEKPEMSLGNIDCMGTSLFCPHCGRPLTKDAWASWRRGWW